MYTRSAGSYLKGRRVKQPTLKKISLAAGELKTVRLYDQQYEKKLWFRGKWLQQLIAKYPGNKEDTALLHFSNGMVLPVATAKNGTLGKKLFIATSWRQKKKDAWQAAFPKILKPNLMYKSLTPSSFFGNKVVLSSSKKDRASGIKQFSPWQHVASLTEIEFVQRSAYDKQFHQSAKADLNRGFQVFRQRCQYCHGLSGVGASFGWDIDGPILLHEKRRADELFLHVRYRKANDSRYASQMPHQKDFSDKEAQILWNWLRYAAKKGASPYSPQ